MTKTLTKHLQAIKDSKRGIFVPYIMAGDHAKGLDGLFETITLLENSGVSAIEVGIPWSDPVADGPIIELAGRDFNSYHQEASRKKDTGAFGYHDLHQPSLSVWY